MHTNGWRPYTSLQVKNWIPRIRIIGEREGKKSSVPANDNQLTVGIFNQKRLQFQTRFNELAICGDA